MRAGVLILFVSLLSAGCKSRNKIPVNILPQSKMQAVMWDMVRADQFLNDFVLHTGSSRDPKGESIKLYQQIFRIHHITQEEFQQSFLYYRAHPDLLKVVLDSLNAHSNNGPPQVYKPQPVADTLLPSVNKHLPRKDTIR
jgi:hypothetical protein